MMITTNMLLYIIFQVIALVIAVVGHEIGHAYSAKWCGDDTAQNEGRLSLNPLKHIDLMGSIIIPLILIFFKSPFILGWAKPVPINIFKIFEKKGFNGLILVSFSGILFNILTTIFCFIILKILLNFGINIKMLNTFILIIASTNIFIGYINILPLPLFDGANILKYISLKYKIEPIYKLYTNLEQHRLIMFINLAILLLFGKYIVIPAIFLIQLLLSLI